MLKVFLVEDEIVMREGIKNHVEWEKEGFEFVGEASDGELAYPMIQSLKPDIIITDIKMPFMDGLELSRLVKKEMPDVKIIVLSGYGEFDYAKQAINIGITDYLLKPVSPGKLMEAVKEVRDKILKEREKYAFPGRYGRGIEEYEILERQRFFDELMFNKMSMAQILENGRRLEIDLTAQEYLVILFQVKPAEEKGLVYSEDIVRIAGRVRELFQNAGRSYLFERGTEGWALLLTEDSEEAIEALRDSAVTSLKGITRGYNGIEYFGGVGRTVKRLRELPQSYDSANRAFALRYMGRKNEICSYEQAEMSVLMQEDAIDLNGLDVAGIDRRILENFLKSGSREEIPHFMAEYFAGMGESSMDSMLFRQYIAMDLYFCAAAFLEELGYGSGSAKEYFGDLLSAAPALTETAAVQRYLEEIIEKALELRDGASMKKYAGILENAKRYIRENYDKEEISLNTVAASVNLSPSHFSTIFSQETGETFIEYLTDVRMEKAKELLMCSNKKTAEIAYAVGYKDSHYFSYLFKKTQECTPKEFRMRGKE